MRITTGTLFFGLAVLLNSIELISSIQKNLGALFPGSNEIYFPSIKKLDYKLVQHSEHFRTLLYRSISDPTAKTFLVRGNVIIGWKHGQDIKPLSLLFDKYNANVVFDIANDEWVTLKQNEFEQLGVNRALPLVRAIDQVAAELSIKHKEGQHVNYKQSELIHIAASQEAFTAASKEEKIQMELLRKGRGIYAGCAYMIQKAYRQAYEKGYRHYSYLTKF